MGFEIKIPEDVQRDAMALIKRIAGPIAEGADFLTGEIRYWRWQRAMKIFARAQEFLKREEVEAKQVPLKFLLPFAEQCSVEEDDETLSDMWARLLASAATSYDSKMLKYIDLLSKLSGDDATMLRELYSQSNVQEVFRPERYSAPSWAHVLDHSVDYNMSLQGRSPDQLRAPGRLVYIIHEDDVPNVNEYSLEAFEPALKLQLLQSLGLVFFAANAMLNDDKKRYFCVLAEITPLGFDFVATCESKPDD